MRGVDVYRCTAAARIATASHRAPTATPRPTGSAAPGSSGTPSSSTPPGTMATHWTSTTATRRVGVLVWRSQEAKHGICFVESHLHLRLCRPVLALIVRQDYDRV